MPSKEDSCGTLSDWSLIKARPGGRTILAPALMSLNLNTINLLGFITTTASRCKWRLRSNSNMFAMLKFYRDVTLAAPVAAVTARSHLSTT